MNSKLIICILTLLIINFNLFCQEERISIGKEMANPNAILDIHSSSKGLIIPKITTKQRIELTHNKESDYIGLFIFDINVQTFMIWDGEKWIKLKLKLSEQSLNYKDNSLIYSNYSNKQNSINLDDYIMQILNTKSLNIVKVEHFSELPTKGSSNQLYQTLDNGYLYKWCHTENKYIVLDLLDKSVETKHFKDNSISNSKIMYKTVVNSNFKDYSINTSKIEDLSIENLNFQDSCINNQHIENYSINNNKFSNNAITTEKIKDLAITAEKIKDHSLSYKKLSDMGAIKNQLLIWDTSNTNSKIEWHPKSLSLFPVFIINNLNTSDPNKALSSFQATILKDSILYNTQNTKKNLELISTIQHNTFNTLKGAINKFLNKNLSPNKVLISNNSGKLDTSIININELKTLKNSTCNIQEKLNTLDQKINTKERDVGDIKYSIINTDHDGWLLCNGSSITPAQFNRIKDEGLETIWLKMGGSATQRPDLRNKILAMRNNSSDLGKTKGEETVKINVNNLPNHNHNVIIPEENLNIYTTNSNNNHTHTIAPQIPNHGTYTEGAKYSNTITHLIKFQDNPSYITYRRDPEMYDNKQIITYSSGNNIAMKCYDITNHKHTFSIPATTTTMSDTENHDHETNLNHTHNIKKGSLFNNINQEDVVIKQASVYINYFIYIGEN